MSTSEPTNWSIIGEGPVADDLRRASRFVRTESPLKVVVDPAPDIAEAFAIGAAAIQTAAERVVPLESAFEAVVAVRDAVASGEIGRIYGCFTSLRLPRGSTPEEVLHSGLLPALALTLDVVPGDPERVWAKRASLFEPDDAWFVTIRLTDETLLTIEAMASEPAGGDRHLLVELTGSERVLRAEPTRQAVVIESLDSPTRRAPWWEDLGERYLHLVVKRAALPADPGGTRLRATWDALLTSSSTGEPVRVMRG